MGRVMTRTTFAAVFLATALVCVFHGIASADRFQSTNYTIDAGVAGNSLGGSQSSTNYKLVSSGGESLIGSASGGSYKLLGKGYVSQLDKSIQLTVHSSDLAVGYEFNEGSGTSVTDTVGYSDSALQFVGNPVWSTGKIGGAVTISSGNYLQSASVNPFSLGQLAVCTWVYPTAASTDPVIAAQSDATLSSANMWELDMVGITRVPRLRVNIGGTVRTVTAGANALPLSTWSYVCGTYDNSALQVYINGVQEGTFTQSGTFTSPATSLTIGGGGAGGALIGKVDHLRFFDPVFSDITKMSAEYDAQNAGVVSGISLGAVTPGGTSKTLQFAATMLTDASAYSVAINQNHDLQNGSYTIPAISSGTLASPVTWSEGSTEGLGVTMTSAASPTALDTKWSSGNAYAAIPGTASTVYLHQGRSGVRDVIGLRLRIDVPATQQSGTYSNTVTLLGTITP